MSVALHVPAADLYTYKEAAGRLKVSERWLRRAVEERSVPHTRLGRRVLFSDAQLVQIIAQNSHDVPRRPARRKPPAA